MRQQAYINQEKSENQNSSLYFGKYDSVHIVNNMGFYMLTKSRDFHQICSSLILHAFATPREINPQYDFDGNLLTDGNLAFSCLSSVDIPGNVILPNCTTPVGSWKTHVSQRGAFFGYSGLVNWISQFWLEESTNEK